MIYQLVEELQLMQYNIAEILKQFEKQEVLLSEEGLKQMKNDCLDMLKAIIWMLDGAKYLWQETEKMSRQRQLLGLTKNWITFVIKIFTKSV